MYSVIPKDKDWLFGFDVIVIGDVSPQLLNLELQEMLVEYVVQRGGGLAMLAGEQYLPLSYEGEPLEQLLPAGVEIPSGGTVGTTASFVYLSWVVAQRSCR